MSEGGETVDRGFGLVGAGIMGKGLARNLLAGGFELSVFDIDPAAVERAVGMGAKPANGLAGLCAAAATIGTCLQSIDAIRAVYLGPDGLIANAREGSVLVDFSTGDPAVTRELAEQGAARSVHVIDAPMLRMEQHAWEGTIVLLVGGPVEIVERCRSAFEAVSERFVHCGPVGSGHIFKLLNNVNGLCMHAMYAETFALAAKLGADLDLLLEVLSSGMSNSTILGALSKRILTAEDGPVFATEVALKDVSLFARLAADTGSPSLLASATREIYQLAALMGYGDKDVVSVGAALREISLGQRAGGAG
ncbi:MAG: NAD(P)-dependent oxidoreductase [Defluviicoccus sp.]|nr:NAD(P)-dependent oxidoreductase [Defluviicoccus sp.]MDE0382756.1 NAD(P)-dependent oxidoreductase [Defluviicoccus sp.]